MATKTCGIVLTGKFVGGTRYWAAALVAGLVAAVAAGVPARPAMAAASPVALGTHSFARIVVDPATSQVFISSLADNLISVLDLMGNPVATISGEPWANGMAVVGGKLYVSLLASGSIDVIDTTSLTKTGTLVTGLVQPGDLAYAGGKLWTTTGACSGGAMKPVSIDLTAVTPTAVVYDNVFTSTNGLQYCAKYATNHASNPSFLLAWGGIPNTADYMDVSGSSPVITRSAPGGGSRDVVVTPDGAHFITDTSAGCPTPNVYCDTEYNLSDLSMDGVNYPSERFPNAVDTTGAGAVGRAKLAGGVAGYNSLSNNTDFLAYRIGDPSTVLTKAWFGTYETNDRGVAISPDGLTAYVVATEGSCNLVACEQLNLISLPDLPLSGSPAAPTAVTATPGVGAAIISWTPPTYSGTSAITGYTVSSSGGATASVGPTTSSALIAGLSPVPHTFTVTATNASGPGDISLPSNPITPLDGGTFNVLTPRRILDTRTGNGGYPIRLVPANTVISLQVTGRGGVPFTGVGAVALNVTVTNAMGSGYVVVYPHGFPRPLASNLNFTRGATVPNLVQVGVGSLGRVDLYVGGASADLIADVQGWVGDSTDSYYQRGLYNPLWPVRMWDTRYVSTANGNLHEPIGPGGSLTLQIAGFGAPGSVPPFGASAVVLNVTVTNPTQAGYLTIFPAGSQRPLASNLNFRAGQTVPNRVVVGLGPSGDITIFNGYGTVDVVVDANGWYSGAGGGGGSAFITGQPSRLFDSRSCGCKLGPGYVDDFQLTGGPLTALSLNVAVTNPTAGSFLTVYPDDGNHGIDPPPLASDLNFTAGETVANMSVVLIPGDLAFNIYNGAGWTDFVVDVDGFYGPVANPLYGGTPPFAPLTITEPRASTRLPSLGGPAKLLVPNS